VSATLVAGGITVTRGPTAVVSEISLTISPQTPDVLTRVLVAGATSST